MSSPLFSFQKATKKKAKLRAAIYGPSGSGKTFSALRIASGIVQEVGGRVAVIDTEFGSASKYADRFDFDCIDLRTRTVATYCQVVREAAKAGYAALVIDSLTHAWHELLSEVEGLASSKYKGNTWSAWSEGTPKQRQLVETMLAFPGHIIATIRSKTEWQTELDSKSGKSRPVRVGLAPEQGKGIEYEFDLLLAISADHVAFVEKDRTGKFQDQAIKKPGEEFGRELVRWLNEGAEVKEEEKSEETPSGGESTPSAGGPLFDPLPAAASGSAVSVATVVQQDRIRDLAKLLKISTRDLNKSIAARTGGSKDMGKLPATEAAAIIEALEAQLQSHQRADANREAFARSQAHPNTHPVNGHAGFATVDQVAMILQLRTSLNMPFDVLRGSIAKRTGDPEKTEPSHLTEAQAKEVIGILSDRLAKSKAEKNAVAS